ncbi:MAG: hypothetical protein IJH83_01970 [Coriobacteriales bacterium]|nr:hypothetical protein [Coriobacteriales bacterium]
MADDQNLVAAEEQAAEEVAEELAEGAEGAEVEEEAPVEIEDLPDEAFDFDDELPEIETPPEVHRIEDPSKATDFELNHYPWVECKKVSDRKLGDRWILSVRIGDEKHVHPQTKEHLFTVCNVYVADGDNRNDTLIDLMKMDVGARHDFKFVLDLPGGSYLYVQVVCNKHGIWESRRIELRDDLFVIKYNEDWSDNLL